MTKSSKAHYSKYKRVKSRSRSRSLLNTTVREPSKSRSLPPTDKKVRKRKRSGRSMTGIPQKASLVMQLYFTDGSDGSYFFTSVQFDTMYGVIYALFFSEERQAMERSRLASMKKSVNSQISAYARSCHYEGRSICISKMYEIVGKAELENDRVINYFEYIGRFDRSAWKRWVVYFTLRALDFRANLIKLMHNKPSEANKFIHIQLMGLVYMSMVFSGSYAGIRKCGPVLLLYPDMPASQEVMDAIMPQKFKSQQFTDRKKKVRDIIATLPPNAISTVNFPSLKILTARGRISKLSDAEATKEIKELYCRVRATKIKYRTN